MHRIIDCSSAVEYNSWANSGKPRVEEKGFEMGIKGKQERREGSLFSEGRWTRSTDAGDFCKRELGRTRGPPRAEEKREKQSRWGLRAAGGSDELERPATWFCHFHPAHGLKGLAESVDGSPSLPPTLAISQECSFQIIKVDMYLL